jgi:hypothetical protein
VIKEVIGIIAASLVFVAYIPYLRDIFKGKTKPHPYSWFVWGFNTVLIFALQISHGAGAGAYTTATVTLMSFFVCALGIKYGTKDIKLIDTICLILAIIAAIIWLFAKEPTFSAILLVFIDMLGFAPSVRKAWNKPGEETLSLWTLNSFRHALSIVALQSYSIITVINPGAWAVANFAFSIILVSRRRKISTPKVVIRSN